MICRKSYLRVKEIFVISFLVLLMAFIVAIWFQQPLYTENAIGIPQKEIEILKKLLTP